MKTTRILAALSFYLLGQLLCVNHAIANAVVIKSVVLDRNLIRHGEQPITVSFYIDQTASVALTIYDARNRAVRIIKSASPLGAGQHQLQWQGDDQQHRPVPPEAYYYTLTATTADGHQTLFDLSDKTGGQVVALQNVHYDETTETLHYDVPVAARVHLRAGIRNAFVIKTLINGAVRNSGQHQQAWNGYDQHQVLSVKGHPNYALQAQAYRLSDNSIIVQGEQGQPLLDAPQWINDLTLKQQRLVEPKPQGLHRYAYQSVEDARDVAVSLSFPKDIKYNSKGLPIITGPVDLTIDMALDDALMIEAQRGEVVYFLDNQILYENEVSYFPYTWTWDPGDLPPGEHYLTAYVVGFAEHFGVSINKIHHLKPDAPTQATHKP